ncbi:MAG: protein of unknown function DUF34 [uncultured bacterium]|nr:MAG: protein of unknown function DUF34 [uncultured bacterium]
MKLSEIISRAEKEIPLHYQEAYDRSGLQVGSKNWEVKKVLFAYDACHEVIEEAIKKKAQLIVTHHPLSMKDYRQINLDTYEGAIIEKAIQNKIAIYSFHTNHDASLLSLNRHYANELGLKKIRVIQATNETPFYKLIVYVPQTHTSQVMEALFAAGAGHIGNYSHCSFRGAGKGTFTGNEKSNPFLGKPGIREEAIEDKLETVVEKINLNKILEQMLLAHPYEEVAYDVIPLTNVRSQIGHGIFGTLEKKTPVKAVITQIKKIFGIQNLVFVGDKTKLIQSIGLCTGSGTSLLNDVFKNKIDLFITGDVKYHYGVEALRHEVCVVDVGHFHSEIKSIEILKDLFDQWFGSSLNLQVYRGLKNPLQFI